MTPSAPSPASNYRFLLLIVPSLFILLLAIGLFEFSSNITIDNFHSLTSRLMQRASETSKESLDPTHILVEVKSRYIWLTTVMVALVAGLYALIVCGIIMCQSLPRPQLLLVTAVGIFFASIGLAFIWSLDDTHALYRAAFSFSYDNLRQARPQRIFYTRPPLNGPHPSRRSGSKTMTCSCHCRTISISSGSCSPRCLRAP
jgi:hypothetical protein